MKDLLDPILDSDLPPALQVTLMHLYRQAEGMLFVGTHADVADARGISRRAASQQIEALSQEGWLEEVGQALRVVTPEQQASTQGVTDSNEGEYTSANGSSTSANGSSGQSEKGFPLSSLPFSPKKVHSTPFEPSLLSPSQSRLKPPSASSPRWLRPSDRFDSIKEPIPEDHPARWDHLPGDWTFRKAQKALEEFEEFDLLATPTQNKLEQDGRRYLISQWADTFRLLQEQDGYSKEEIEETMEWLFQPGNFWIERPAIQSVPPLRSKTSNGDAYKFDVMYQQAHSDNGSTSPQEDDAKQRPAENYGRLRKAMQSA